MNKLSPKEKRGEKLYALISVKHPELASKLVGMILDNDIELIDRLLTNPSVLEDRVFLALESLKNHGSCAQEETSAKTPTSPAAAVSSTDEAVDYDWRAEDDAPLLVPSIVSASAPSSQLDQALEAPRSKSGATKSVLSVPRSDRVTKVSGVSSSGPAPEPSSITATKESVLSVPRRARATRVSVVSSSGPSAVPSTVTAPKESALLALETLENHGSGAKDEAATDTLPLLTAVTSTVDELVDYNRRTEEDAPLLAPHSVAAAARSPQLDQALKAPRFKDVAASHLRATSGVEEDVALSDKSATADGHTAMATTNSGAVIAGAPASDDEIGCRASDDSGFIPVLRKKWRRNSPRAGVSLTVVAERS